MPNDPLVSIVVTNYNYSRFIEECLASIAAQTYRRIEVIIVDDRSTDDSVEVIRNFLKSDSRAARFELIVQDVNGGQMAAFMDGVKRATGLFVVFMDADDYLLPTFVESHLRAHLNTQMAAALSSSNEHQIDTDGNLISYGLDYWRLPVEGSRKLGGPTKIDAISVAHSIDPRGEKEIVLQYIGPHADPAHKWMWSTTSGIMFRKAAVDLALHDVVRSMRISADYFLLHFCHLLGGTLLIHESLGCYRRHGSNNFAKLGTVGHGSMLSAPVGDRYDGYLRDAILARLPEIEQICGVRSLRIACVFNPFRDIFRINSRTSGGSIPTLCRLIVLFTSERISKIALNFAIQLRAAGLLRSH